MQNFHLVFHVLLHVVDAFKCEYVGSLTCFQMHRFLRYIATPLCVHGNNQTTLTILLLFSSIIYEPYFLVSFLDGWPPCVRVIVVRSPVLEPGTLFILTADSIATFGRSVTRLCVCCLWFSKSSLCMNLSCVCICREKDMDHAIRIPEMGVSKVWTVRISQLRYVYN